MNWPTAAVAMVAIMFTALVVNAAQRATSVPGYLVVTTCGTLPSGITYTAGTYQPGTINTSGTRC